MRALRLVLVAAFAAGLVAACGGESLSPEAAVAEAATKTGEAGSSRASFAVTFKEAAGEPVTLRGKGLFDSSSRRGRMTFDLRELGEASGQRLGTMEMIFDRLVIYMKLPALQRAAPGLIKPWLKFDLKALGKEQGFDLGQLSQLNQSDPSQSLAYLRAASDRVEDLGEEDVRGVSTTHYRLVVDLEKVAEQAPDQKANVERIIGVSGLKKVPADVWIDDEGLVRRMELQYRKVRFGPDQTGDMTMTMELYDFGVAVDVEPPPADQVTDIRELAGAGVGGGIGERMRQSAWT